MIFVGIALKIPPTLLWANNNTIIFYMQIVFEMIFAMITDKKYDGLR